MSTTILSVCDVCNRRFTYDGKIPIEIRKRCNRCLENHGTVHPATEEGSPKAGEGFKPKVGGRPAPKDATRTRKDERDDI